MTPYRTRNTRFAVVQAAQRDEHGSITTRNPGNVGFNVRDDLILAYIVSLKAQNGGG
jgi:hypothetical protein